MEINYVYFVERHWAQMSGIESVWDTEHDARMERNRLNSGNINCGFHLIGRFRLNEQNGKDERWAKMANLDYFDQEDDDLVD